LTLHHPSLLWADLRAGLLSVTGRQVRALRQGRADAVLVVGDVYAQGLATLLAGARRFVVQPLVSVRLAEGGGRVRWNRTFMERIRRRSAGCCGVPRRSTLATSRPPRGCGRAASRRPASSATR
jgi:hypothetical protein